MTLTEVTMAMVLVLAIVIAGAWIFSPPAGPTEKIVRSAIHPFRVDRVWGGKFAHLAVTDMATGLHYKAPYCDRATEGQTLALKEEAWADVVPDVTLGWTVRLSVGGMDEACAALTPRPNPAP